MGDGEEQLLGFVEQYVDVVGVGVAHLGDLVADLDQLAQHALLANDLGVVHDGRGCRHAFGQRVDELSAADLFQHGLTV